MTATSVRVRESVKKAFCIRKMAQVFQDNSARSVIYMERTLLKYLKI